MLVYYVFLQGCGTLPQKDWYGSFQTPDSVREVSLVSIQSAVQRRIGLLLTRLSDTGRQDVRRGRELPRIRSLRVRSNYASTAPDDLRPGRYEFTLEGFCLGVGQPRPGRGSEFTAAPLLPSNTLSRILTGLGSRPDIPRQDAQKLLWGLRAGTEIRNMSSDIRRTAEAIEPGFTVRQAIRALFGRIAMQGVRSLTARLNTLLPPSLADQLSRVTQVTNRIRTSLPYRELESLAVAPPITDNDPDARQPWLHTPNGYYLKLAPNGYSSAKAYVIVPAPVASYVVRDGLGRVARMGVADRIDVTFHYADDSPPLTVPAAKPLPVWRIDQVRMAAAGGTWVLNSECWIARDIDRLAGLHETDSPLDNLIESAQRLRADRNDLTRYLPRSARGRIADAIAFRHCLDAIRYFESGAEWDWEPVAGVIGGEDRVL